MRYLGKPPRSMCLSWRIPCRGKDKVVLDGGSIFRLCSNIFNRSEAVHRTRQQKKRPGLQVFYQHAFTSNLRIPRTATSVSRKYPASRNK